MRTLLAGLIVLGIGLVAVPRARAQYHDTRVLQKSFERSDFFFRPGWLNPYGLGSFGGAAAGVVRDPLVELQLGPSRAGADSSGNDLIYLDFRSTREQRETGGVYPVYYDDVRAVEGDMASTRYGYWPYYYEQSRKLAEPVITAALFARPLPTTVPGLTLGMTYEAVVDDQDYYAIPQDVYRSVQGADFAGERVADSNMPIYDIYGGENDMHLSGHFPTLYAAMALENGWRVGVRAAFADFDRSGSAGSVYNDSYPQNDYRSMNSNVEERDQRYLHRDLSFGLERTFETGITAGASIGYLDGRARQNLVRSDTSLYAYGTPPSGAITENWSRYERGGSTDARWREDGGTTHGSAFFRRVGGDGKAFTATYRLERQQVDLEVGSTVQDTSFSVNRWWYDQNQHSANDYHSRLLDVRSGDGERTGTAHRASLAMEWPVADGGRLALGAVLTVDRTETSTLESVDVYRSQYYRYEWADGVDLRDETIVEDKALEWNFESRRSAIRIPVLYTHRFSEQIEILAGITREMAEWRIEDVTLAHIDRRSVTVNGETEIRAGFIERYREPIEQRTDVSTDLLLGLTVTPAAQFDARLLVMPTWRDTPYGSSVREYRWWLGLTFRP